MSTKLRSQIHVMSIKEDVNSLKFYVKTRFLHKSLIEILLSSARVRTLLSTTKNIITDNPPVKKGMSSLLVLSTPKAKAMVESFLIEFSRS